MAAACVPFADAVLAWDIAADLYVVATYHERAVPPTPGKRVYPNLLELRRVSTGAQLSVVNCAMEATSVGAGTATTPCDFRVMFGTMIPKSARFVLHGTAVPPGRLSVREVRDPDAGFALMARSRAGSMHRVRWLGQTTTPGGERQTFRLGASERWQDTVLVVVETRLRSNECDRTEAKLLRLQAGEIDEGVGPAQQKQLLAHLKLSSSVDDWRTAADLAPLPPEKLVFGMVVAAEAGRKDLAARWWREGTSGLPLDKIASLAAALRQRPELAATRQLITLPPEQ